MKIKIDNNLIESLKEIMMIQLKENESKEDNIDKDDLSEYISLLIENNIDEFRNRKSK